MLDASRPALRSPLEAPLLRVTTSHYARLSSVTNSPVNLHKTLNGPVEIEKINGRPATAIRGIDRDKEARFFLHYHLTR